MEAWIGVFHFVFDHIHLFGFKVPVTESSLGFITHTQPSAALCPELEQVVPDCGGLWLTLREHNTVWLAPWLHVSTQLHNLGSGSKDRC